MNAAEITDKLGLHSLRQRAWVSILNKNIEDIMLMVSSTSNPPVLPPEMVCMKVWSGSHKLSERVVTNKLLSPITSSRLSLQTFKVIESPYHNVSITILGAGSLESSMSLRSHFHERRKGGYCTMNQATAFFLGCCIAFSFENIARLSLFRAFSVFDFLTSGALPSCVSAWYKSSR